MTHDALKFATASEFSMLGEALQSNATLKVLDVSRNTSLEENLECHQEIISGLVEGK